MAVNWLDERREQAAKELGETFANVLHNVGDDGHGCWSADKCFNTTVAAFNAGWDSLLACLSEAGPEFEEEAPSKDGASPLFVNGARWQHSQLRAVIAAAKFQGNCSECKRLWNENEQFRALTALNSEKLAILLGEAKLERESLSVKLQRTVDAAYHALLEMSAWMGIPEKKREKQIEEYMSNVKYCAEHDLREHDESQRNKALRDRIAELEAECLEEARLNGIGSEREAKLESEIAQLKHDMKFTVSYEAHGAEVKRLREALIAVEIDAVKCDGGNQFVISKFAMDLVCQALEGRSK